MPADIFADLFSSSPLSLFHYATIFASRFHFTEPLPIALSLFSLFARLPIFSITPVQLMADMMPFFFFIFTLILHFDIIDTGYAITLWYASRRHWWYWQVAVLFSLMNSCPAPAAASPYHYFAWYFHAAITVSLLIAGFRLSITLHCFAIAVISFSLIILYYWCHIIDMPLFTLPTPLRHYIFDADTLFAHYYFSLRRLLPLAATMLFHAFAIAIILLFSPLIFFTLFITLPYFRRCHFDAQFRLMPLRYFDASSHLILLILRLLALTPCHACGGALLFLFIFAILRHWCLLRQLSLSHYFAITHTFAIIFASRHADMPIISY